MALTTTTLGSRHETSPNRNNVYVKLQAALKLQRLLVITSTKQYDRHASSSYERLSIAPTRNERYSCSYIGSRPDPVRATSLQRLETTHARLFLDLQTAVQVAAVRAVLTDTVRVSTKTRRYSTARTFPPAPPSSWPSSPRLRC